MEIRPVAMRTVAIANQKGGVGKTTTAVNLAAGLAQNGKRVLLIDLDPQANATTGLGLGGSATATIYHALLGELPLSAVLLNAFPEGLSLAPSSPDLAGAEVELYGRPDRERRLQDALAPVAGFDYALIDCPPALNMLTINALVAADSVLIPMQCEYYALEGLTQLLGTVRRVRAQLNPRLEVHGLLRTMFDNRNRLASEVALELERHFPDKLYQAVVPRNIRLAEAPSFGRAALVYDPACAGSRAYQGVATEFLRREWMK
ncbi:MULTISPECIES: ParA family protein [Acidithiobacillus]|jgi:chromosome partitioning protein|uniref:Chromosome partitioning protein parA n=3 Tax=Acidithiobacillus ferrooxidans TaxID=920 RepID=B7JB93_ACIF2|nr:MULTISPECIES: AAA family ATPase [Acidithiobacillus]MCL5956639.1 AAA family ATPase [Gammaproteobacteria bacterium]ACH85002.1 Cobyrinic acid ac-diamide synthase [Acidithiobacillus ferrooxidans ATCC 53993]ACK79060.1 chromosome partitioning protein parA [Acidithiobacillus ferrooxidans ATCC 23270]MBU2772409.1 ParA family protein [Acidithiobacillus ferrooxidans]MBU2807546.1 ParA family protein [Acidithiobacillus ferrooxidans F221]